MKIINFGAILIIAVMLLLFSVFQFFMIKIDVGETGVRTKQYAIFGEKGVEKKDFGPGWHRSFPFIDTWNIFDSTVQTTEFTTQKERQMANYRKSFLSVSKNYDSQPVTGPERIELKSKDGYTVHLDVTVKYRIAPGYVHELYRKFNTEVRYKEIVRDQVQNQMRSVFGTMKTEAFYNPQIRREKTKEAIALLSADLKENYIELVSILIRDINFDKSYERKILDKKLADQDVELNKSKAFAEEKKGETNKIIAETEAKVRVIDEERKAEKLTMKAETDKQITQIESDARLKVARLKADADLYEAELLAKGNLLEKEAYAKGHALKAQALQGSGGANFVALEAAKSLSFSDIKFSTIDNDILDVEGMVKKLGAKK